VKILLSWLREFVDVTAAAEDLGSMLSMRGFELAAIEPVETRGREPFSAQSDDKGSRPLIADAVLDFEITANRPDCLSVIGLARETATSYSLPMRQPAHNGPGPLALRGLQALPRNQQASIGLTVDLEAPDLCPRYAAAIVDVKVGPSPAWLAGRLHAAGIRPINNVVDVTNYVLLELGQPMHTFDLARLSGNALRIRRAKPGERIETLDGETRTLDPEMLVIADAERPQAVAGVMGGALSEVGTGTKTVVLESACFEPRSVRRTSKRLGLKTEASARFERGSDINAAVLGIARACALFEEIGAGQARGAVIDEYPVPAKERRLRLRGARIERLLGQAVDASTVSRVLSGLGFRARSTGEAEASWDVTVPSFRVDVAREADLIEEIARHHGYDKLPETFPALTRFPAPSDPRIERDQLVRRVLLAAGCSESVTFSFIDSTAAEAFAAEADRVAIGNPLSAQFAVLRPSLLPGLLASVAHNRHREWRDVNLFEIGACVTRVGERRHVAVAWTGTAGPSHWSGGTHSVDFFDVKGLGERLGEVLQAPLSLDGSTPPAYLVKGRAASVVHDGRSLGCVGLLAPQIAAASGLPKDDEVYVVELDLDAVEEVRGTLDEGAPVHQRPPLKVIPLPRYPSIVRDISIVVDDTLPAEAVRGTIRSAAPSTLVSVHEFDRYQGKGVPDGRVSLSLRLTFRSLERTLTDAEVDAVMKEIVSALAKAHNAVQR
jgi:phenylalanyl-tRNA synthetase beta chain